MLFSNIRLTFFFIYIGLLAYFERSWIAFSTTSNNKETKNILVNSCRGKPRRLNANAPQKKASNAKDPHRLPPFPISGTSILFSQLIRMQQKHCFGLSIKQPMGKWDQ